MEEVTPPPGAVTLITRGARACRKVGAERVGVEPASGHDGDDDIDPLGGERVHEGGVGAACHQARLDLRVIGSADLVDPDAVDIEFGQDVDEGTPSGLSEGQAAGMEVARLNRGLQVGCASMYYLQSNRAPLEACAYVACNRIQDGEVRFDIVRLTHYRYSSEYRPRR